MRRLLLVLSFLFATVTMAYASPPDSCLKMIWPNDYHEWVDEHGVAQGFGSINPDSIRVDSCVGSATFNRYYAKKYFSMEFEKYYYPFETGLKEDSIKDVDAISNSKPLLKQEFLNLQAKFGKLYFKGVNNEPYSILLQNPGVLIFFDDYQDIEVIVDEFKSVVDSLKEIIYLWHAVVYTSVNESEDDNVSITILPNPIINTLQINSELNLNGEMVEIYNTMGNKVYENSFTPKIEATFLPSGMYFIKVGNKFSKFIKE